MTTLLLICQFLLMATCYNLAPKHAHVFSDPSSQEGSYFGFSVDLQRAKDNSNWLLVGAPRGNSSQSVHANISEPGTTYLCDLHETGPGPGPCKPITLDNKGRYTDPDLKYKQRLDEAWIGGSLAVENGITVVCGSRATNDHFANPTESRFAVRFMNGICYVTKSLEQGNETEKLLPLVGLDTRYILKSGARKRGYLYGYGQAGFSTHFAKGGREILLGAPGVYDWTGTVIRYDTDTLKNPDIPNPSATAGLQGFSYLGYSLGSGNFLDVGGNITYYVAGAPRAGDSFQGKVYIFDYGKQEGANPKPVLRLQREMTGETAGEYYGATVCVQDVNGDLRDDILVGAPRFATRQAWDQGRIYVHLREGNLTFSSPQTILGSRQSGAQFGSAISCLGDIDMDGYNDFAVGAPYEDGGRGAVYVYYGSGEGPRADSRMRIAASHVDNSLRGFGMSISGGLDVDDNNYLDFAVGAFLSGHACLIKSQPVVTLLPSMTPNVSSITFNATGFKITTCLKYTGIHAPPSADAVVVLTLDDRFRRVHLASSNKWNNSYDVNLAQNEIQCQDFHVEIQTMLQDFSQPIDLKMEYGLKSGSNGAEFCKTCPVLNPTQVHPITMKLPYATGCSVNNRCKPDLVLDTQFLNLEPPLAIGSQGTVELEVALHNTGEPAFLAYIFVTLPTPCSLLRIPVNCQISKGEIKCLMGNPVTQDIKRLKLEVDVKGLRPGVQGLFFLVRAESVGNELTTADNLVTLELPLVTQADISVEGYASQEELVYNNETSFSHLYMIRNLGPSELYRVNLEFSIPLSVQAAQHFLQITNIQAVHDSRTVHCTRSDQSDTTTPGEAANGNDILEEIPVSLLGNGTDDNYYYNLSEIMAGNPLAKMSAQQRMVVVECNQDDVTCVTVTCTLDPPIASQSLATVNFSLVANFTDLEAALGPQDIVYIFSRGRARIELPQYASQPEVNRPDHAEVGTTFHSRYRGGLLDYAILGWTIGSGILLLVIIILILWRIGFFKRKRVGERYYAHIQKSEEMVD